MFVLDFSGSIGSAHFKVMIKTVKTFIDNFDIGQEKIRVGLVKFNFKPISEIALDEFSDKNDLQQKLQKIKTSTYGGTRTDRALKFVRKIFEKEDRDGVPKIMVVLTDGQSNKPNLTNKEADKLKSTSIHVVTIGIGNEVDVTELERIASDKKNVFQTNFDELPNIVGKLVNKTCIRKYKYYQFLSQ